jgi:hypothetical protein
MFKENHHKISSSAPISQHHLLSLGLVKRKSSCTIKKSIIKIYKNWAWTQNRGILWKWDPLKSRISNWKACNVQECFCSFVSKMMKGKVECYVLLLLFLHFTLHSTSLKFGIFIPFFFFFLNDHFVVQVKDIFELRSSWVSINGQVLNYTIQGSMFEIFWKFAERRSIMECVDVCEDFWVSFVSLLCHWEKI